MTYGQVMSPHSHRWIQEIEGSGSTVESLGEKVAKFGDKMIEAGDTLNTIKDRASEQQGRAIEKLQESIGESGSVLKEAGQMYKPFGEVIQTYGSTLTGHVNTIKTRTDNAYTALATFNDLPGYVEPRGAGGWFQPDEGSEEAEKNAEEDRAKKRAWDTYLARAREWEDAVDSWEGTYDEAVRGVAGVLDKGISDGWKEWLENIATFLSWAGMIVGIAALIIGGPILGAIAAAIAIASLVVTLVQFARGEKGIWDVVIGIVGVLPIGKMGSLFKGSFWKGLGKGTVIGKFKDIGKGITQWKAAGRLKPDASVFQKLRMTLGGQYGRTGMTRGGLDNFLSRLLTGQNASKWNNSNAAGWELLWSMQGQFFKYQGWYATATDSTNWKSGIRDFLNLPPWTKIIW